MHQLTPQRHVENNVHPCRPANIGILGLIFAGCVLMMVAGDSMITVIRMEQEIVSLVRKLMLQNTISLEIKTKALRII